MVYAEENATFRAVAVEEMVLDNGQARARLAGTSVAHRSVR